MKTMIHWCGAVALLGTLCVAGLRATSPAQAQDHHWPHPRPIPLPRPIPWPQPALQQELQLETQSAKVAISSGLAKTSLVQNFRNVTNRTIEGTYVFPLPEGAAISGFAMTANGKRMEAEILEGDKAREIYTGIVQKMRDPAILEFIDRNLVRARIFPIAPGAIQKIELEYAETLKPESGAFRYVLPLRLPTGGSAKSASVDISIASNEGIRAVYSPTHEIEVKKGTNSARVSAEFGVAQPTLRPVVDSARKIPNRDGADRDFVLYYIVDKARIGVNVVSFKEAGDDGYFMLLAAPDAAISQKEIPAKDVVFVCDTSGSMEGAKIEQARRALLTLIGSLNANDRFNIVTFSSDTRTFKDAIVPADKNNIAAARAWVNGIKAVGGTNIDEALQTALRFVSAAPINGMTRPQQVVFMTDGQPTVGETDVEQILKNTRAANKNLPSTARRDEFANVGRARLFTFGVGYDVNTRLLDTLAEDNNGASDYVLPQEDIEAKVGSIYGKIAFPVLTDARLDWGAMKVYDVYPKRLPDLFKGGQVVVFGRYAGAEKSRVQLIGANMGREEKIANDINFGGDARNDVLPRLWAMRKVGYLLEDARRTNRAVDAEVKDEIIKLSKKFGIVTPYTAALITEDERPARVPRDPNPDPRPWPIDPPMPMDGRAAEDAAVFGAMNDSASAPSSGRTAVLASKARSDLRDAARLPNSATPEIRYLDGKTFVLREGVWTDTIYDAAKSPKPETIKFASPQYFALLKDKTLAKWLSVGDRAIIVLKDRTIQIVP